MAINSGATIGFGLEKPGAMYELFIRNLRPHSHSHALARAHAALSVDKQAYTVLTSYCEKTNTVGRGSKPPSITALPQNGFPRTWGNEAFGVNIHSNKPPDGCVKCAYNFTTPSADLMVDAERVENSRSIPFITSYINAESRAKEGTLYAEHLLSPPRANPSTYGLHIPANVGVATVSGDGAIGAIAGEMSIFRVSILRDNYTFTMTTAATTHREKIFVAARIVGATIEPCVLKFVSISNDTLEEVYEFSYQLEADIAVCGVYGLEIRVTNTQSLNHLVHRGRICVRPGPSIDLVPMNDTKIINKQVDANNLDLCTHGNSTGRWVDTSVSLVNDQYGYNDGYYWQPYDCKYRTFESKEISQCFRDHNVKRIGFCGDSLGRELMSNLNHFMQTGKYFNGKDFKPAWRNSLSFDSFDAVWLGRDTEEDLKAVHPQIYIYAPRIVTALTTETVEDILAKNVIKLKETYLICQKLKIRMIFYSNPTIQHGSVHHPKAVRKHITDENVSKVVLVLIQLAQDLQIEILDGTQITKARWYASHDGTHYTWSSFLNELRPKEDVVQWQGGVSYMITTVLLNVICNTL